MHIKERKEKGDNKLSTSCCWANPQQSAWGRVTTCALPYPKKVGIDPGAVLQMDY